VENGRKGGNWEKRENGENDGGNFPLVLLKKSRQPLYVYLIAVGYETITLPSLWFIQNGRGHNLFIIL
jgi:hypothetical protein